MLTPEVAGEMFKDAVLARVLLLSLLLTTVSVATESVEEGGNKAHRYGLQVPFFTCWFRGNRQAPVCIPNTWVWLVYREPLCKTKPSYADLASFCWAHRKSILYTASTQS